MSEGRIAVLCSPAAASGFSLAGLQPSEARDKAEATRRLTALLSNADLAVLLIESGLYENLGDEDRRRLAARPLPLVVPFPSPAWEARAAAEDTYIVELLRRAIGYQVRLR